MQKNEPAVVPSIAGEMIAWMHDGDTPPSHVSIMVEYPSGKSTVWELNTEDELAIKIEEGDDERVTVEVAGIWNYPGSS